MVRAVFAVADGVVVGASRTAVAIGFHLKG
jgi:hypothetical protein